MSVSSSEHGSSRPSTIEGTPSDTSDGGGDPERVSTGSRMDPKGSGPVTMPEILQWYWVFRESVTLGTRVDISPLFSTPEKFLDGRDSERSRRAFPEVTIICDSKSRS